MIMNLASLLSLRVVPIRKILMVDVKILSGVIKGYLFHIFHTNWARLFTVYFVPKYISIIMEVTENIKNHHPQSKV